MLKLKSGRRADKAKSGSPNADVGAPLSREKSLKKIRDFIRDEDGLETVEYAIILGLIVAGTIGLAVWLGGWVQSQYQIGKTSVGS